MAVFASNPSATDGYISLVGYVAGSLDVIRTDLYILGYRRVGDYAFAKRGVGIVRVVVRKEQLCGIDGSGLKFLQHYSCRPEGWTDMARARGFDIIDMTIDFERRTG